MLYAKTHTAQRVIFFVFFCPIFFLVVLRLQNVSPSHKFAENEGKRSENIMGANISLYTVN